MANHRRQLCNGHARGNQDRPGMVRVHDTARTQHRHSGQSSPTTVTAMRGGTIARVGGGCVLCSTWRFAPRAASVRRARSQRNNTKQKQCEPSGQGSTITCNLTTCNSLLQGNNPDAACMHHTNMDKRKRNGVSSYGDWKQRQILHASSPAACGPTFFFHPARQISVRSLGLRTQRAADARRHAGSRQLCLLA